MQIAKCKFSICILHFAMSLRKNSLFAGSGRVFGAFQLFLKDAQSPSGAMALYLKPIGGRFGGKGEHKFCRAVRGKNGGLPQDRVRKLAPRRRLLRREIGISTNR